IGESCNDISCSDDLFNDNYRQSCTTNTGFIRQQESQSEDNYNNDNNNDLSVFESKKERSLLDEDNQLSTISDDNIYFCIRNYIQEVDGFKLSSMDNIYSTLLLYIIKSIKRQLTADDNTSIKTCSSIER
ncbi:uncharacterized protein LOC128965828, partial [Oppia nitens]|uniref:uncharacterized protein LOC128965828 n=1 Tax=Oppia nitens TaxID=1686743 RepID=UPI0023DBB60B